MCFINHGRISEAKRRKGQESVARRVKENYGGAVRPYAGISEDRFLVAGHIVGCATALRTV